MLAHYLEEEGIPTTHISLIREHTERIKPPRALWVPFELGRPFGVPGDAVWQTRVLRAVLGLLESSSGPVLDDFPDDAPVATDEPAVLSCPVNFPAPITDLHDMERLGEALQNEVRELRSWYDLAVTKSGRTTVGASGLDPETMGTFVGAFLDGGMPPSPQDDVPAIAMFKLAVEDLKAYYFEAMAAQPGQRAVKGAVLADWAARVGLDVETDLLLGVFADAQVRHQEMADFKSYRVVLGDGFAEGLSLLSVLDGGLEGGCSHTYRPGCYVDAPCLQSAHDLAEPLPLDTADQAAHRRAEVVMALIVAISL